MADKPDSTEPTKVDVKDQTETDDTKGEKKETTFDQEQVNAVVSKRVNEVTESLTDKFEKSTKEAVEEALRINNLKGEEKRKAEEAQAKTDMAKREQSLKIREAKIAAGSKLQEKGLDPSLVDLVVDEDESVMTNNIEKLETTFNKAVEDKVAEELKGETPKDMGVNDVQEATDETGQITTVS